MSRMNREQQINYDALVGVLAKVQRSREPAVSLLVVASDLLHAFAAATGIGIDQAAHMAVLRMRETNGTVDFMRKLFDDPELASFTKIRIARIPVVAK